MPNPTNKLITLFLAGMILTVWSAHGKTNTMSLSCEWLTGLQEKLVSMGLPPDATNATRAAVEAVVRTVDTGARIVDPKEWLAIREQRDGLAYLTGIRLGITNGLPVILEIDTGANAEKAGLKIGDLISGIETQRFDKIALPDALLMLRGQQEGPVSLWYRRGDISNQVVVTRSLLRQSSVEVAEVLPNNIGYIKVNGLFEGSGRDIVPRVRAWSENQRDGMILDLRGAGGSDSASVVQVVSLFSRSGQFLFAFRDHHQQDLEIFKAAEGDPVTMPLMVLIDRNTTGAAEVLTAAVNGINREALLIGETTAGDFNLREAVDVTGQLVFMSTRVLDTADGNRYNGQYGLEPAVLVGERDRDTHDFEPAANLLDRRQVLEEEARDAATRRRVRGDGTLERAVDILIGLKSLNKAASKVSSPEIL